MNELANTVSPSSEDEKMHAMIVHLLGIFFGFVPALIFWLMYKDNPDRAFITDQAKEALNFQLNVTVVYFIGLITIIIIVGIFITFAVMIANLVFCILAGVAANQGQAYRYPSFIIRMIK